MLVYVETVFILKYMGIKLSFKSEEHSLSRSRAHSGNTGLMEGIFPQMRHQDIN